MAERKSSFVNVDDLQKQLDWETVWRYYGLDPGEVHRTGKEIRTRCFLNCGRREETGDRALAFDTRHPLWRCHQYGCGKGGNIARFCGVVKYGANLPDLLRGDQFKAVREDLRAMVEGTGTGKASAAPAESEAAPPEQQEAEVNVPLTASTNERARALVQLDEKFLVKPDERMNKSAASYMRQRPYMTSEACRAWRCGYLPRDSGSDRSGGTMRGKFVYPMLDEAGRVLSWFGRDPEFEQKQEAWVQAGRQTKGEPRKHHFVKGFHRGLEVFGQHRIIADEVRSAIESLGMLVMVEGPNDTIALDALDVPAFAVCSNVITATQATWAATKARELGVPVGLMFDTDTEGETGARQSLPAIAEQAPVRFVWSSSMHGGAFKGRQPETLSAEDWQQIVSKL